MLTWGTMAGLLPPQPRIEPTTLEQLAMVAPLHDPSLIQHAGLIRSHDRAQPMGDHQHRALPLEPLALAVEGTGGLIEDQQLRLAQDCPRQ